ncbi:MAG: DUF2752 domain-containing protein [Thermonemataceae bacterium]
MWKYKLWSAVGLYLLFSVLLNLTCHIDIGIPCLWTTLFHVHCPGCGLTRAFTRLLVLDVVGAYHYNPLIFIVLPGGLLYILSDFLRFYKANHTK